MSEPEGKKLYYRYRKEMTQWNRTSLSMIAMHEIISWLATRVVEERDRAEGLTDTTADEVTKAHRQVTAGKAREGKLKKQVEKLKAEIEQLQSEDSSE